MPTEKLLLDALAFTQRVLGYQFHFGYTSSRHIRDLLDDTIFERKHSRLFYVVLLCLLDYHAFRKRRISFTAPRATHLVFKQRYTIY